MTQRAFRFGVSASRSRSRSQWIDFARRAEGMGYDTLVMPDHFGSRFAPAPALVLAAQATTRLRVGSLVYDNDFRHPAVLAQEIATVDILTDGRFDFGIGAGWLKSEYDAAGLRFDPGGVRVQRMTEALEIVTQLLSGEPVTFEGVHYRLQELTGAAKTIQQPHPPILIGGGGQRLLTLAARVADIISVMPRSRKDGSGLEDADGSSTAFAEKIGWIREAAGERFDQITLNTLVQAVSLTDDPDAEAERLSTEWQMPPAMILASPLLLLGSPEAISEMLAEQRQRLGITYITVFEKDMESFAQVIARMHSLSLIGR